MGLDDRRQATGRDSGECPKTVTYISSLFFNNFWSIYFLINTENHICTRVTRKEKWWHTMSVTSPVWDTVEKSVSSVDLLSLLTLPWHSSVKLCSRSIHCSQYILTTLQLTNKLCSVVCNINCHNCFYWRIKTHFRAGIQIGRILHLNIVVDACLCTFVISTWNVAYYAKAPSLLCRWFQTCQKLVTLYVWIDLSGIRCL